MTTEFKIENLKITPNLKNWLVETLDCPATWTDEELYRQKLVDALTDGDLDDDDLHQLKTMAIAQRIVFDDLSQGDNMPDPTKIFQSGNGNIDVKEPSQQYSSEKKTLTNKYGQTVRDPIYQKDCESQSQSDAAKMGVLFKHLARKSGLVSLDISEHEKQLLNELTEKDDWCGKIGDEYYDSIKGHRNIKALVDDSTSGGLEVIPIQFDSDIVSFPLLTGELSPLVDMRPVPRGRRIEGASINTPTMSWGGGDNTSISLFSTDDLVAAIDTTIFTIDLAMEVGRDFLSDSPVNVGQVLTQLIGDRLSNELDKVIASGNGTTQPEGVFTKSGVSSVTPDNTTTGPPTLDDYLDLLFTVDKQYRKQMYLPVFISNDVSYSRSKAIKVDTASPSTDQRPVMSPLTEVNDYRTLGWPHKIENNLANGKAGFFCLGKYRLYRRLGMEVRWVDGGTTLARKNCMLLIARARYGGQLTDASSGSKWQNGQS